MKIYIKNANNKAIASVIRRSVKFYAKTLLPRSYDKLTIHITINGNMHNNMMGTTQVLLGINRPKTFHIEINSNLKGRRLFETISHEMVHVKQYASDQLKDYVNSSVVRYNNKFFTINESTIDYWTSPWEVEAYGLGYGIYRKFLHSHKLKPSDLREKRGRIIAYRKLQ